MDNEKKRKITSLDIFAVVLAVLCVAGLAVRLLTGRDGVLPESAPERGEYEVSFEIVRQRSGYEISAGEIFYTDDDRVFGSLTDNISVTPAAIYSENSEGKMTLGYSSAEGDNSLVDVRGTMKVSGYPVGYGFLVDGKTFISPNYTLTLHTDKTTVNVKITNIAKTGD